MGAIAINVLAPVSYVNWQKNVVRKGLTESLIGEVTLIKDIYRKKKTEQ